MKMSEIPTKAFDAKPTDIPTKIVEVYDWEKFYSVLETRGFVVIECSGDDIRMTKLGAEEAAPLKAFNSWMRANFGRHIKTRRLSATRWFISL